MISETIINTPNVLFLLFLIFYYQNVIYQLYSILNISNYSNEKNEKEDQEHIQEKKPEIKYEDKYLDQVLKMRSEQEQEEREYLKNAFIIEKTPLGNVAMYYNSKRESFTYFSDSTIPYRFLEVVARKYVLTFHCTELYIIMEEELKKYEKKLEELEKRKQLEEEKQKVENNQPNPIKKNVFAKFKSYNKEAGSGRVNKAPPPKNSIPQSKINTSENSEKVILKENANRYTFEGRFSNFNPLKKVERKQVDKKYAMSFADFKKMRLNNENK